VVVNLLSNAAKYTPEGGRVALRASATEAWVTIQVEDNGIGIAQEDNRSSSSTSRSSAPRIRRN